jgi:hypothetical protein
MHIEQIDPIFFPLCFAAIWIAATISLGAMSGWYSLAAAYPDRDEPAEQTFLSVSGMMGAWVSFSRVLSIDVCPSGLRVRIWRIFGPFCRPFFVPWSDLRVERTTRFLRPAAELSFGGVGRLALYGDTANRLALAAGRNWPEQSTPAPEPASKAALSALAGWAIVTALASTFFIVAPRLMPPSNAPTIPIPLAIGLPAVVFGISTLIRFFGRSR